MFVSAALAAHFGTSVGVWALVVVMDSASRRRQMRYCGIFGGFGNDKGIGLRQMLQLKINQWEQRMQVLNKAWGGEGGRRKR